MILVNVDFFIFLSDYYIEARRKSRELREKTANLLNIVSDHMTFMRWSHDRHVMCT